MYLIRGKQNIDLFLERHQDIDLIATIGNFDGLHLGHQHIIKNMEKDAKMKNWKKKLKIDQLIHLRSILKGVIIFKKIHLEKIGMEYGP